VTAPARPAVAVGDELPAFVATVTRADLARYAAASGDGNPIHLDDSAARAAGLPGVVAHGMATLALAARLVTAWAGPGAAVATLRTRFPRPLVVPAEGGAEVAVSGRVAEVADDGSVRVDLTVTSGGTAVLLQARAVVRPAAAASGGPG
jgi:acyl dehydratase